MTVELSPEQARHLLTAYHFTPTTLEGVIERLGTVQYDPLNPVGRNPDLVFQARVPGYRVDDWQKAAYIERIIYDAWDKQACLVPVQDWAKRVLIREKYRPYHDRQILQQEAEVVAAVLAEIDARGPLSSHEFADKASMGTGHSWYGQTRTKRVLRSLWACGELLTHHRKAGRHYYDRPERIIPAEYFQQDPLRDEAEYHRWIILKRHQAAGILRKSADPAIWSACDVSSVCNQAKEELVESGLLTPVRIGDKPWVYYVLTSALALLDTPLPEPRMIFVGPLDSLIWDRKGIGHIFGFDYLWEVYKPESQRKWGYYVLPVFYKNRFVARIDSRLEKGIWQVSHWWWEPDIQPDTELLDALRQASRQFMDYMGANGVQTSDAVDAEVSKAIRVM